MLIIEVDYLTGRAVASDRQSRTQAEWPPHPQRLFSAMVAAMYECDLGDEARDALLWLEQLQPPELLLSEYAERACLETYVPVNDNNSQIVLNRKKRTLKFMSSIDSGIALGRDRKERFFPTIIPFDPIVQFVWKDVAEADLEQHQEALQTLCESVAYLGHSSSLVRVSLADKKAALPQWRLRRKSDPKGMAGATLRGVATGRLQQLDAAFQLSEKTVRRREASDAPWHRYVKTCEGLPTTEKRINAFGDQRNWFVFKRTSGKPLPLQACLALTQSVRKAVCSLGDDDAPAILIGHESDSSPLQRNHVAFLPLANTGYQHSRGEIHGFAIVLPAATSPQERQQIAIRLGDLLKVWMNHNGERTEADLSFDWSVSIASPADSLQSLRPSRYTGTSKFWATTTPMVFGHFLRKLDEPRTAKIVGRACQAIGLPLPKYVHVSPVSMVQGVPPSFRFPSLSSEGKPVWVRYRNGKFTLPKRLPGGQAVRMRYHVAVEFEEPVEGPVILGAGRHYGMGLCVPMRGLKVTKPKEKQHDV
ncbi:type I-G CRISPR-associated protein Csb2 [Allorhodopirellula solitaria]|uniref:CRISPR-associated protein n=1 Tax=Allorhodopirellula solitaria TaxID=2527987 RepID=A0A5C5YIY2_9BACT|nr:type I-U CRISPR-associated protein Csb2 [Allorhodopirellula solitaria]TWT74823.1 CRISPR-associated protein [Allorhodopirellula solitaria]